MQVIANLKSSLNAKYLAIGLGFVAALMLSIALGLATKQVANAITTAQDMGGGGCLAPNAPKMMTLEERAAANTCQRGTASISAPPQPQVTLSSYTPQTISPIEIAYRAAHGAAVCIGEHKPGCNGHPASTSSSKPKTTTAKSTPKATTPATTTQAPAPTSSAPTNTQTPSAGTSVVVASSSTTYSQPQPTQTPAQSTGKSGGLPNTGPGDVLGLFVGTSAIGAIGHRLYARRRAN